GGRGRGAAALVEGRGGWCGAGADGAEEGQHGPPADPLPAGVVHRVADDLAGIGDDAVDELPVLGGERVGLVANEALGEGCVLEHLGDVAASALDEVPGQAITREAVAVAREVLGEAV